MNMKKYVLKYLVLLLSLTSNFSVKAQQDRANGNLTVFVKNIRNNKGQIGFCLFKTSLGFPKHPGRAIQRAFVKIDGNSAEYTFTNVRFGMYAVCVFHDENDDKKINTNFIGIPTEGVGVSNNAKGHFGPPKFDDAKFNLMKAGQTLTISITYL
jgi:uncharacterized protein (DUF2141 family)